MSEQNETGLLDGNPVSQQEYEAHQAMRQEEEPLQPEGFKKMTESMLDSARTAENKHYEMVRRITETGIDEEQDETTDIR